MSLFSTQRAGVPMSNAYSFTTVGELPDQSLMFQALQAGQSSSRASARTSRASDGDTKGPEGLYGAVREWHETRDFVDRERQSIYQKNLQRFNNMETPDLNAFIDQWGDEITREMAQLNTIEYDLKAGLPRMKRDAEHFETLRGNKDFMENTVLSMGMGGEINAFGLKRDGTEGWGPIQHMLKVYTGQEALGVFEDESSFTGTDLPSAYDPNSGREALRTLINDKAPNLVSLTGNSGQNFTNNFNALDAFVASSLKELSQSDILSLVNQSLMQSELVEIQDEDKKTIGFEYRLPVYTPQTDVLDITDASGRIVNQQEKYVLYPAIGPDGQPVYVNPIQYPGAAVEAMASQIQASLAAGREKVTVQDRINVGGMGTTKSPGMAWWTALANNSNYLVGTDVVLGFGNVKENMLGNMERIGAAAGTGQKRAAQAAAWEDFLSRGNNRELVERRDPVAIQQGMQYVVNHLRTVDEENLGYGNYARTAPWNSFGQQISAALGNSSVGRVLGAGADVLNLGRVFQRNGILRVEVTNKRPEEVLMDAVYGQRVRRVAIPGPVALNTDAYFNLNNGYSGEIRLTGGAITNTSELVSGANIDKRFPIDFTGHGLSNSIFMIGGREFQVPSAEVVIYLTKEEMKKYPMYTHTANGRETKSAWEIYGEINKVQKDGKNYLIGENANRNARMYGNEDLYAVPGEVPILNHMELDAFLDQFEQIPTRAIGQAELDLENNLRQVARRQAIFSASEVTRNSISVHDQSNTQNQQIK